MGAVFAIFAGFYYWVEKITGLQYDQLLANLHFCIFFFGVNLCFFPMHFLGLSGMPRRITDHPDFYRGWSDLSSWGSSISFLATILFFYIVFDMFVHGEGGKKSPYTIKLLTKIQLSNTLLKLYKAKKNILIRGLFVGIYYDVAENWQFGFQDPATPLMAGIVDLHHDLMFFLLWIIIVVSYLLFMFSYRINNNFINKYIVKFNDSFVNKIMSIFNLTSINPIITPINIQHNTKLEIIWTVVPCIILFLIAIPSFSLLYVIEDLNIIECTLKIIGSQWYWEYELPCDGFEKKLDSRMIPESDLTVGHFRLLDVDNKLVLPAEKQLRLFITSTDVLHSYAVPSLGLKMDACPGRLNQVALYIKRQGTYYGQCSEICGINHAFMPIVVSVVDYSEFLRWLIPTSTDINSLVSDPKVSYL